MEAWVKARPWHFSQRSAVPRLCFRTPGCAHLPVFLLPSNEGNGAPGGASGALRSAPLGRFARPACASCFRDPSRLRAVGIPGRTGPCEEPCASRRSIAARIVGGRTLLRHPVSRSTTPSIEQGMADIDQNARNAKLSPRVCKLLQHRCGKPPNRTWETSLSPFTPPSCPRLAVQRTASLRSPMSRASTPWRQSKTWMAGTIGERSDAVLRTARARPSRYSLRK